MYHNWQDAHYNIKPHGSTRGFHIELNKNWFKKNDINSHEFEGSINLKNPKTIRLVNNVFLETKINDTQSQISIEQLLVQIFDEIQGGNNQISKKPNWVKTLREMIIDQPHGDFSLSNLSKELNIHPSHLSRDFSRHFGSTLGDYIRLQKVNKAILLIINGEYSMTEICYDCGFYDQSHFILNFKRIYQTTPAKFSKDISNVKNILF